MTIKKAIKILEYYIAEKEKHLERSIEYEKKAYEKDTFEIPKMMRENLESEITILKILQAQIVPKCRHPKKYQDKMKNGNLYCMNCNMDL